MITSNSNAVASTRRYLLLATSATGAALASLAIATPAAAQSTVSTNQYSTVNLSAGTNPLTITAGTTITSGGATGVFGAAGTTWQLDNEGDIDAGGDGVQLQSAGNVANSGTIAGTAAAVRLQEGGGVTNTGLITAGGYGIVTQGSFAAVSNSGTILAGNDGISLNHGGAVSNSGTVSGYHMGIYTGHAAGTVENSGLVTATSGDAVSLYNGGTFSNTATGILHGGYSGLFAEGAAAVTNAGEIVGTSFGVYLDGAASLSNSGVIAGRLDGVIDVGTHGDVINSGEISGTVNGVRMAADGLILNSGTITGGVTAVTLGSGGTLTNTATGLLDGAVSGVRAAGHDVIDNAGTILGGLTLGAGSTLDNTGSIDGAIALTGTDELILDTGSDITGAVNGGASASQITLAGTGALSADLTNFGTGSALDVLPGADWTAAGRWTIGDVENAGTLQPGDAGQTLAITGNFTQASTGTLRIAVSPNAASALAITGSASLAGHLLYVLAPGAYEPGSTDVLTATKGITGAFSTISTNQPASQPAPVATPAATPTPAPAASAPAPSVTPTVTPAVIPAVTPAVTPAATPSATPIAAQTAAPVAAPVAAVTQAATPSATPAPATVTSAPAATVTPAATTAATPAAPSAVSFAEVTATSASLVVTQAFTVAPADATLMSANDQDMTLAAERAGDDIMGHATTPAPSPCLPADALPKGRSTAGVAGAIANAACRLGGWAEATGTNTTQSGGYNSHQAGFLAGIDRTLPTGTRLGLAIGYDADSLKDDQSGRVDSSTLRAGLYGAQPIGAFILSAEATDAFATTRSSRATGDGTATARPHANIIEGAVALSAPMSVSGLGILPSAGLRIAHLTTASATETAPLTAFAVRFSATHATSLRPYVSVTFAHDYVTDTHVILTPSLSVGANYEADNAAPVTTLTTGTTSLTARATPLARASETGSAGLTATQGAWSLSARYIVQTGNNYSSQTAEAAVQMAF
jgi:hypothetical protein